MILKKIFTAVLAIASLHATAQDSTDVDLDALVSDQTEKSYAMNAFKSSRVINGHSMEMIGKGVLDFRILHRFGTINDGVKTLFGLDNASMRMGFDYGLHKNVTIGIGRSTLNKELDGFVKWRIAHQHTGKQAIPVSILYIGGLTAKTNNLGISDSIATTADRLGYYHQIIVGRKFNEKLTLQVAPTFVHTNLVNTTLDKNDVIALGVGARYKLNGSLALVVDAHPILYGGTNSAQMPLSAGIDIETGGHVFQLHFSNATGMNERAFITETSNKWTKAEIRFGFNLSRVFTIVKNEATSF